MAKIKTYGTLLSAEPTYRKSFGNKAGVILRFSTKNYGSISRTFTFPHRLNRYSVLGRFLNSMKLKLPVFVLSAHTLLAEEIELLARGKEYELDLETTNKSDYPFNIVGINCIH